MNKYELIIIVNIKTTEDTRKEILDSIRNYISKEGSILNIENIGEKNLAYSIRKQNKGIYYIITFNDIPNEISGLQSLCRIVEGILKYIVVKKDDEEGR